MKKRARSLWTVLLFGVVAILFLPATLVASDGKDEMDPLAELASCQFGYGGSKFTGHWVVAFDWDCDTTGGTAELILKDDLSVVCKVTQTEVNEGAPNEFDEVLTLTGNEFAEFGRGRWGTSNDGKLYVVINCLADGRGGGILLKASTASGLDGGMEVQETSACMDPSFFPNGRTGCYTASHVNSSQEDYWEH